MIRFTSERQLPLDGFLLPFGGTLSPSNRWSKLSGAILWDDLVKGYDEKMDARHGRPAKNGRLVIGTVIIKHELSLSDEGRCCRSRKTRISNILEGFHVVRTNCLLYPASLVSQRLEQRLM